jgi:hypothetical protein
VAGITMRSHWFVDGHDRLRAALRKASLKGGETTEAPWPSSKLDACNLRGE